MDQSTDIFTLYHLSQVAVGIHIEDHNRKIILLA